MTNDHQGLFPLTLISATWTLSEETKVFIGSEDREREGIWGADFTQEFIERLLVSRSFILTI